MPATQQRAARRGRASSADRALARQKEQWLSGLRRIEWEIAKDADRSGIYGVLHMRSSENIDSPVTIGIHTSVPAGKILHRTGEPASGEWLPKTVRRFVPPWTITATEPSIYPH